MSSSVVMYAAGFLFCDNHVALVRKARPQWQAGKLNAIGGHIEEGETPHEAMVREFQEETSVRVEQWDHVATLKGNGFSVHFYSAHVGTMMELFGAPDEPVEWYSVDGLSYENVMPNLRWLLPLARRNDSNDWPLLAVERGTQ